MTKLSRLQLAFMVTVITAILAVVVAMQIFGYPEEPWWMVATRGPGQLVAAIGLPSILVGMWCWMRYGKGTLAEAARAAFVRWIAASVRVLAVGTLLFTGVILYSTYKIIITKAVRVSVAGFDDSAIFIYADCVDTNNPSATCGQSRKVESDGSVWLRVRRSGSNIVIETRSSKLPPIAVVREIADSTFVKLTPPIPQPPKVSKAKALVLIYEFDAPTEKPKYTLLTESIQDAFMQYYHGDDVEVVLAGTKYREEVATAWSAKGIRPTVTMYGGYDDAQVRLHIIPAETGYTLHVPHGKQDDDALRLLLPGSLGFSVGRVEKLRVAVGSSLGMTALVEKYPAQAAEAVRLLLALHFLNGRRAKAAVDVIATGPTSAASDLDGGPTLLRCLLGILAGLWQSTPVDEDWGRALHMALRRNSLADATLNISEVDMRRLTVVALMAGAIARLHVLNTELARAMRMSAGIAQGIPRQRGLAVVHAYDIVFGSDWTKWFDFQQKYQKDIWGLSLCTDIPEGAGATDEDAAKRDYVDMLREVVEATILVASHMSPRERAALCADVPLTPGRVLSPRQTLDTLAEVATASCPGLAGEPSLAAGFSRLAKICQPPVR